MLAPVASLRLFTMDVFYTPCTSYTSRHETQGAVSTQWPPLNLISIRWTALGADGATALPPRRVCYRPLGLRNHNHARVAPGRAGLCCNHLSPLGHNHVSEDFIRHLRVGLLEDEFQAGQHAFRIFPMGQPLLGECLTV